MATALPADALVFDGDTALTGVFWERYWPRGPDDTPAEPTSDLMWRARRPRVGGLTPSLGSSAPAVHDPATEPTVGGGHHVCPDL
jgi:hypothetical protein